MGVILWEDSIQQSLAEDRIYAAHTAPPMEARHGWHARTLGSDEDRASHISYAARRSVYFAHTRTGERYAARPVVRVDVSDNWR